MCAGLIHNSSVQDLSPDKVPGEAKGCGVKTTPRWWNRKPFVSSSQETRLGGKGSNGQRVQNNMPKVVTRQNTAMFLRKRRFRDADCTFHPNDKSIRNRQQRAISWRKIVELSANTKAAAHLSAGLAVSDFYQYIAPKPKPFGITEFAQLPQPGRTKAIGTRK